MSGACSDRLPDRYAVHFLHEACACSFAAVVPEHRPRRRSLRTRCAWWTSFALSTPRRVDGALPSTIAAHRPKRARAITSVVRRSPGGQASRCPPYVGWMTLFHPPPQRTTKPRARPHLSRPPKPRWASFALPTLRRVDDALPSTIAAHRPRRARAITSVIRRSPGGQASRCPPYVGWMALFHPPSPRIERSARALTSAVAKAPVGRLRVALPVGWMTLFHPPPQRTDRSANVPSPHSSAKAPVGKLRVAHPT